MKTQLQIQKILSDCKYKDWQFHLTAKGDGYLFQIRFWGECNFTGKRELQHCRKWYISPHMCESEIVNTVFFACKVAEEHEVREQFRYKNTAVYNGHISIGWLAENGFPIETRNK